jgi:BMFP domain-containing protein YqiC
MSDDLVKRLDNLWSMLEDEGFYTKANTSILAANRIEELEAKLAKSDGEKQLLLGRIEELEAKLAKAEAIREWKR